MCVHASAHTHTRLWRSQALRLLYWSIEVVFYLNSGIADIASQALLQESFVSTSWVLELSVGLLCSLNINMCFEDLNSNPHDCTMTTLFTVPVTQVKPGNFELHNLANLYSNQIYVYWKKQLLIWIQDSNKNTEFYPTNLNETLPSEY